MGESLGEGYFGRMEDFLGDVLGDEGEEFRRSMASRIDSTGTSTSIPSEGEGGEEGTSVSGILESEYGVGEQDQRRKSIIVDQAMIPGDLEHEFYLAKKKKFPGVSIVQVFLKSVYYKIITLNTLDKHCAALMHLTHNGEWPTELSTKNNIPVTLPSQCRPFV